MPVLRLKCLLLHQRGIFINTILIWKMEESVFFLDNTGKLNNAMVIIQGRKHGNQSLFEFAHFGYSTINHQVVWCVASFWQFFNKEWLWQKLLLFHRNLNRIGHPHRHLQSDGVSHSFYF